MAGVALLEAAHSIAHVCHAACVVGKRGFGGCNSMVAGEVAVVVEITSDGGATIMFLIMVVWRIFPGRLMTRRARHMHTALTCRFLIVGQVRLTYLRGLVTTAEMSCGRHPTALPNVLMALSVALPSLKSNSSRR